MSENYSECFKQTQNFLKVQPEATLALCFHVAIKFSSFYKIINSFHNVSSKILSYLKIILKAMKINETVTGKKTATTMLN